MSSVAKCFFHPAPPPRRSPLPSLEVTTPGLKKYFVYILIIRLCAHPQDNPLHKRGSWCRMQFTPFMCDSPNTPRRVFDARPSTCKKVRFAKAVLLLGCSSHPSGATRPTPHGASSRLVKSKSAWSVKTRRSPSRHCSDARVCLYMAIRITMHAMSKGCVFNGYK